MVGRCLSFRLERKQEPSWNELGSLLDRKEAAGGHCWIGLDGGIRWPDANLQQRELSISVFLGMRCCPIGHT